jgi:hypothetical protein
MSTRAREHYNRLQESFRQHRRKGFSLMQKNGAGQALSKSEAGGVSFWEDTARIRKKVATPKSSERQ